MSGQSFSDKEIKKLVEGALVDENSYKANVKIIKSKVKSGDE